MDDLSSKQLLPESEEHQERRHRRLNVDLDDTDIPLDSRRLCLKEWAGKANWKSGGAARGRIGKLPKAPMTAEDAYALYMQSQAVQHFKTESIDASNEGDDLNLIKVILTRACIRISNRYGIQVPCILEGIKPRLSSHKLYVHESNQWDSLVDQIPAYEQVCTSQQDG